MRLKTKVNDYKATLISLHKDKKKLTHSKWVFLVASVFQYNLYFEMY